MDIETAKKLCEINNDFYREHAASFSQTRQAPWPGWKTCVDVIKDECVAVSSSQDHLTSLSVLDLASGNLRFESFLESEMPHTEFTFYTVDNCDRFAAPAAMSQLRSRVHHQDLDIMETLFNGSGLSSRLHIPPCDIAVSFGFLHHVPLAQFRQKVLAGLIEQTRPGGYIMVSFWQFMTSEHLAQKARTTHERALKDLGLTALDSQDYLLGWQGIPGAYRYCHSFTQPEIEELLKTATNTATLVSCFTPENTSDNLNTYAVLKKGPKGDGSCGSSL